MKGLLVFVLVVVVVAAAVFWFLSTRGTPKGARVSHPEATPPSQRYDRGLNAPIVGGSHPELETGAGIAGTAGLSAASETNWGGNPTQAAAETGPAHVSWDSDAQDEDALMTDRTAQDDDWAAQVPQGATPPDADQNEYADVAQPAEVNIEPLPEAVEGQSGPTADPTFDEGPDEGQRPSVR